MAFGEAANSVCYEVLCRKLEQVIQSGRDGGEGDSVREARDGVSEKVPFQLIDRKTPLNKTGTKHFRLWNYKGPEQEQRGCVPTAEPWRAALPLMRPSLPSPLLPLISLHPLCLSLPT